MFFILYVLYNGTSIFELISLSSFNYIYSKIDEDVVTAIKNTMGENNKLTFAVSNTYIYKERAPVRSHSAVNEIRVTQNQTNPILNITTDEGKVITLIKDLKREFTYTKMT